MTKKLLSLLLVFALLFTTAALASCSASSETVITLSDSGVKVNGASASTSSSSAVYTGADIIYYQEGQGDSYGEGSSEEEHSASEAAAHTVVTITKAGTYRVSGTLSAGQLAIDLGENAADDPSAVVTLILDGVDITCTVAPAVIFYNVYECGSADTATSTSSVDTTAAGANVILADGSVNMVNGSHVARIYKEGTTKKLHKYDGAFYSKMSMNVTGQSAGTGELHITADNEGLDSELHLTINGGNIWIESQDDGINTNEDGVSVTTINGGTLYINAGLGTEGDGIDSNGYLVINGGQIITLANGRSGDGGIDADSDILLNGGTVIALGSRNDATSSASQQAFIELSYASTQAAGTLIRIENSEGAEILTFAPLKEYQSFTFTSPLLELGETYAVYSGGAVTGAAQTDGLYAKGGSYTGGIRQQYTGNSFGMMGGPGGMVTPGMGVPPEGDMPDREGGTPPEGMERPERPSGDAEGQPPEPPEGFQPGQMDGNRPGRWEQQETGEGSAEFTLTETTHSFSGVSAWENASGKTAVTFSVNGGDGMPSVSSGETVILADISASVKKTGETVTLPASDIQVTVTDVPSENYAQTCLLSDGVEALSALLPTEDGAYQLTVSVISTNETYTGTSQWGFTIGALPFTDVREQSGDYEAVKYVYQAGLMVGTEETRFSPNLPVTRAMAVTVLGRLAQVTDSASSPFTDVHEGSWYAPYVGWAAQNSIVKGYGYDLFGPEDSVTRQQMCVILANYASANGISLETGQCTYSDEAQIAGWAADAVGACQASGLLESIVKDNAFQPDAALTRAELAQCFLALSRLA